MGRALTVTRRAVTLERENAYLTERSVEARRIADDGDHLWVFRHESHPGVYLEFRESVDQDRLTAHDPTAEVWHEVALQSENSPPVRKDDPA